MTEVVIPDEEKIGLLALERLEKGRELFSSLDSILQVLEEVGIEKKPVRIYSFGSLDGDEEVEVIKPESLRHLERATSVVFVPDPVGDAVHDSEHELAKVYACIFDTGNIRFVGIGNPKGFNDDLTHDVELSSGDLSTLVGPALSKALEYSKSVYEVETLHDIILINNRSEPVSALNDVVSSAYDKAEKSVSSPMDLVDLPDVSPTE